MRQDPFVSRLSFHPPTPKRYYCKQITAVEFTRDRQKPPSSLPPDTKILLEFSSFQKFLLPSSKQNECNLVGWKKGREKGERGGEKQEMERKTWNGERRVQLIGPGTSCPSSSTLDSWESRPPQASSVASSFCATIRRFFFIQTFSRHSIPRRTPPPLPTDRFRVPFPFYAERDVDREVGQIEAGYGREKVDFGFCFFEVRWNREAGKEKKEN